MAFPTSTSGVRGREDISQDLPTVLRVVLENKQFLIAFRVGLARF
jgi:hypothetical protein